MPAPRTAEPGGAAPRTVPDPGGRAPGVRLRPHIGDEVSELQKLPSGNARAAKSGSEKNAGTMPAAIVSQARAGWDAYQRGDVKAAKAALSEAARHPGAPPWVHYTLGWAELALADYPAASTDWERVRQAVPEFQPVYFDLADSYLQQKEYGKAVAALRDAERRWPKDSEVVNALGVVQASRGAIDDAVKSFEQAVTLNAGDATSCYNLARMLEVRYVRLTRLRRSLVGTQDGNSVSDKERAIAYYGRTVLLGGPLVDSAKEGLKRLGAAQ